MKKSLAWIGLLAVGAVFVGCGNPRNDKFATSKSTARQEGKPVGRPDVIAPATAPCEGQAVHRHRNPDGSEGGWVANTATVAPTATIGRIAWVCDRAKVLGRASVIGNTWVSDDAYVGDNAVIDGDAVVYGTSYIYQSARISGEAQVSGNSQVYGQAQVFEQALVFEDTAIKDNARVHGTAQITNGPEIYAGYPNGTQIGGNAEITQNLSGGEHYGTAPASGF